MKLTPEVAKMILKPLRESGIPPKFGLEFFSSGFEDVFYILEKEYLKKKIINLPGKPALLTWISFESLTHNRNLFALYLRPREPGISNFETP